jgi:hypothetical protein
MTPLLSAVTATGWFFGISFALWWHRSVQVDRALQAVRVAVRVPAQLGR